MPSLPERNARAPFPPALLLSLALLTAALPPGGAGAAESGSRAALRSLLLRVPTGRPVRLTLDTGARLTGRIRGVDADSVRLAAPAAAAALADVLTLEEQRSGWATGTKVGMTTGAVVGGAFGLLAGTYLGAINDPEDGDWPVVLTCTALCLAAGGLGGGALGAGVGGLVTHWEPLFPEPDRGRPRGSLRTAPPGETRLELTAGLAAAQDGPYAPRAWGGRVGLLRRIGRGLDLGPELGFYDLGETVRIQENGGTTSLRVSPATQMGAGLSWRRERAGWQPYLAGGLALYLRNEAYTGASVGAGLAWQRASGSALLVDLRHHFCLSEHQDPTSRNFTTFQAGLRCAF